MHFTENKTDDSMDTAKITHIIRPCTYQDLYKVIEINEVALPENYPYYFFEQIYEKYPESFLVAELQTDTLGANKIYVGPTLRMGRIRSVGKTDPTRCFWEIW